MIQVPLVEQLLSFTCGPATCRAVLLYHGIDVGESKLARELGCDPQFGTQPWAMSDLLKYYLPRSYGRRRLGLRGLRRALDGGWPTIVLYLDPRGYGHYAVAVHLGDEITLMNPSGYWEQLEVRSFLDRWKDAACTPEYVRWGLVARK